MLTVNTGKAPSPTDRRPDSSRRSAAFGEQEHAVIASAPRFTVRLDGGRDSERQLTRLLRQISCQPPTTVQPPTAGKAAYMYVCTST